MLMLSDDLDGEQPFTLAGHEINFSTLPIILKYLTRGSGQYKVTHSWEPIKRLPVVVLKW